MLGQQVGCLIDQWETRKRTEFDLRVQDVMGVIDRLEEVIDHVDRMETLCGDWDASYRKQVEERLRPISGLLLYLELVDHAERRAAMNSSLKKKRAQGRSAQKCDG